MSVVCIRDGVPEDTQMLLALEEDAFGVRRWPGASLATCLDQPFVFVHFAMVRADCDGPKGFIVWRQIADEAEILSLGVNSNSQRQGIARALVRHFHDCAKARNLQRVLLEVAKENLGALALYAGAGYQQIGQRRHYYRDGADAIVMAKTLSTG